MSEDRRELVTNLGTFVVRRPSEAEAIALAQKRFNGKLGRYSVDALDDGDEEVQDCVVSPSRGELEELLEDAPGLADVLENAINELAGGAFEVLPGDQAALITEELRQKHGPRLVVATHAGESYVLRKLSRVELKLLERRQDQIKATAEAGRAHLVQGTIDPVRWPMLAAQLGTYLLQQTRAKVVVDQGKSSSSSAETPPPKS